jgi:hypothetical protein
MSELNTAMRTLSLYFEKFYVINFLYDEMIQTMTDEQYTDLKKRIHTWSDYEKNIEDIWEGLKVHQRLKVIKSCNTIIMSRVSLSGMSQSI